MLWFLRILTQYLLSPSFFWNSHPSDWEVAAHVVLICISPVDNRILLILVCSYTLKKKKDNISGNSGIQWVWAAFTSWGVLHFTVSSWRGSPVLQPFSSILVSIHHSESQEGKIIVLCWVMCPPLCFVIMLRQFTAWVCGSWKDIEVLSDGENGCHTWDQNRLFVSEKNHFATFESQAHHVRNLIMQGNW